jgi:hypothetical protein
MVGEALAIPGSGGRGVGAISITLEYRRRLDIIDGKKVPAWSAQDEGRPLLAFAGGSVRNAGSAKVGHHTIQTASARCAITLIKWARYSEEP